MSRSDTPLVHPTAIIDPEARLAPDVRVGPYAIIDGPVTVGPGCTIGPHAHLLGRVTLGRDNTVGTGCVLGGEPQHTGYAGEDTTVSIGDGNTFREHATVHRGMPGTPGTVIGHGNLFMVNSHVAHDCRVGDRAVFANGAAVGGHAVVGDRAFLSGNTCVHQFCRVGRLALLSGTTAISQDLPPFWIAHDGINTVHGVNVIGMRRAGISNDEIRAVRQAFRTIHLRGLTISTAVNRVEAEDGRLPAVRELVDFIRASTRGICAGRGRGAAPHETADRAAEAAPTPTIKAA